MKISDTLVTNINTLGKTVASKLLDGVLSHVKDPKQVDMIQRNTALLGAATTLSIGASDAVKAELENDINASLAVLESLASAAGEDAAAAVRSTVQSVIEQGVKIGLTFLTTAIAV